MNLYTIEAVRNQIEYEEVLTYHIGLISQINRQDHTERRESHTLLLN
jgi:hypothetical protein